MNRPSRTTVGASRSMASSRSFSRKRVNPVGRDVPGWGSATSIPAAPPDPPAIGFVNVLPVDLAQLTRRPLHGIFGLHALAGLGIHVHDDVFRVDLGGLG